MGPARPPDTGISPQCVNAVPSTAGLALSSELQASAAGASALGRGGDGAGPELMQCQREPGPADAAALSNQDHGKQDKRWGEMAAVGRPRRSGPHPALSPPVSLPRAWGCLPLPICDPQLLQSPPGEVSTRNVGSGGTTELPGAALALQNHSLFAQSYMIVETPSGSTRREPTSPGTDDVRFCVTLDQENLNQP